MTDNKIKVVVAEHKLLVKKALTALIQTDPDLVVVAEASNGKELLDQLKQKPADLVILDTEMTILETREAMKVILTRFPNVRIIILSEHADEQSRAEFMAMGAGSFLSKTCDEKILFNAIHKVHNDGFFFDNSTSLALLSKLVKNKQVSERLPEARFNDRETEIIRKICDGKTNKEIASGLHLSISTIDFYRTKIYTKTKCNNATGLLKFALKNGIVALL